MNNSAKTQPQLNEDNCDQTRVAQDEAALRRIEKIFQEMMDRFDGDVDVTGFLVKASSCPEFRCDSALREQMYREITCAHARYYISRFFDALIAASTQT